MFRLTPARRVLLAATLLSLAAPAFAQTGGVVAPVKGLPATGSMQMTTYRVDRDHTNPYAVWRRMGAPAQPTPAHDTTTRNGPSELACAIAASTCAASVTSAFANVWPSSLASC